MHRAHGECQKSLRITARTILPVQCDLIFPLLFDFTLGRCCHYTSRLVLFNRETIQVLHIVWRLQDTVKD
jgi:hypothetical protein